MDLLTNEPKIEDEKNKKILRIILVIVGILVVLSIVLVCLIMYMQSTILKVSVDGVTKTFEEGFFVFEDNTVYVPIKEFAKEIAGYEAQNGEYQKNTEDKNKCYIESINEVAMFSLGSNVIYKTEPNGITYENFTIESPVKNINEQLYVSSEGIEIACNVKFNYSKQTNKITIQTLPALVKFYTQEIKEKGYAGLSDDFNSQKAILQNLLVVVQEKENNKKLGVINTKGDDIIGTKYDQITFLESTREFFVTNNNKVGILSTKGEVKIPLENDALELLDNDLKLYLATSNGKKGVLDEYGKIILYKEYDEIGIDTTLFPSNNIENKYLLFDNAIPVKKDGKYGLYDKTGKEILPLNYSGFGYIQSTTKDKSVNNLLILPEYEGIVLSIEYGEGQDKTKRYGIVNSLGEEIVPFGLDEIYSITSQGKEEYYVVYQGGELALSKIKFNPTSTTSNINNTEESEEERTNTNSNELNQSNSSTTYNTTQENDNKNSNESNDTQEQEKSSEQEENNNNE